MTHLLAPFVAGTSDALFGSRMLGRGAARRGGKPLYKLAGNEVLGWGQHALAGVQPSKEHGGYRLHRVSALTSIRYGANSNDFGFDTEIILQLLDAGARITERAIPTCSADDCYHVHRHRYEAQVMTPYALHRRALVHRDRFQPVPVGNDQCEPKLGFAPGHSAAPCAVPDDSRRLRHDSGFPIQVVKGIPAPIPKAIGNSRLSRGLLWLNQALIRISPGLFSYQLCVNAAVTPNVATVLSSTRASVEATTA